MLLSLQVHVGDRRRHARGELPFGEVCARAQPRRIAQRVRERQILVQNILLRHVPDDAAVGVQVFVIVVPVVVDLPLRRGAHAVEAVQKGALARAAPADDGDEFARLDAEGRLRHQRDLPVCVAVVHFF